MSVIKRKPGRPAKNNPVVEVKPKQTVAQLRNELATQKLLNEALLNAQEEYEKMHAKIVHEFENELDEAYKQHEHMLAVAFGQLGYTQEHLANIEYHAGSLTMEDVAASLSVVKRILHHKFAYKPQMMEM